MKLKLLMSMSLPVIALPAVALISCSNSGNELTPDENNEQIFLVNQAAKNKYSPKIELKSDVNIGEIDSKIINFDNIPKEDKNLSYEILNFEIPLVNAIDTNVNVKVSSKLNKDIFETYSFKVSSAIIKNNFSITPMSVESFKNAVNEVYFAKENFLSNLINDISIRIGQASTELDISLKKNNSLTNTIMSIFDIPSEKDIFVNNVETCIQSTIINQMNELALQQGIKIEVTDIVRKKNSTSGAEISVNIIFGLDSVYNLERFSVSSFSTNYFDLEEELGKILLEKIKPSLLIGASSNPIPIWDLYNNLSVVIPENLDQNSDFGIGINTSSPIPPNTTEEFEIEIEIFSRKFSDRINGKYKIKIKDIINFESGKIDFSATNPPSFLSKNFTQVNNRKVAKWK